MQNHRKFLLLAFLTAAIHILSACAILNYDGTTLNSVASIRALPEINKPPVRDLGGITINIASWWSDYDTSTYVPQTDAERARLKDRMLQEQTYNFKMNEVIYGSWHDLRDNLTTELQSGNRDFQLYVIEPSWFVGNNNQGLFAPIDMRYFNEESGIQWNRSLLDLTMRIGVPHGFAYHAEPAGGVYFNMRLLEESGVQRDLPFILQAQNNWTWDTFTEMARRLSRDTNGDGITDIWAITSFCQEFLNYALASNGAAYARVDPQTGIFINATREPAFLEAVEFAVQLREEGLAMHEADVGGEWNAFVQEFNAGRGAIRVGGNYIVAGEISPVLTDDYGFVAFPRGPRMETYMSWVISNLCVIPFFYAAEEVDNFMFAMQRWIRPLPTDEMNDWISEQIPYHRDARSYNETMALYTFNSEFQTMPAHTMMPGVHQLYGGLFAWRIWIEFSAAQIINDAQQPWEAFIERTNSFGG